MDIDSTTIGIGRVAGHIVPKKLTGQPPFQLFDAEIALDNDARTYMLQKIKESLIAAETEAMFDPDGPALLRERAHSYMENDAWDLIEHSKQLATHLRDCQKPISSGGLFIVAEGYCMTGRCLMLMKLEQGTGLDMVSETAEDGSTRLTLKRVGGLTLPSDAKVFKMAMVYKRQDGQVWLAVTDNQKGEGGVADFFMGEFLGCTFKTSPEILTKNFYNFTEKYINQSVTNIEARVDYELQLNALMKSNAHVVDPVAFIENSLRDEDRDPFVNAMVEAGMATTNFEKETRLISGKLEKMHIKFDGGIVVSGPPDSMSHVEVINSTDGTVAEIRFTGQVSSVKGG